MKKYPQKNVTNAYITSFTSKRWYKPFCVVLTILTLVLFFGVSFFVGYGVRGCSKSSSVVSAYASESQPFYVVDTSLRSFSSLGISYPESSSSTSSDLAVSNLLMNFRFTVNSEGCRINVCYYKLSQGAFDGSISYTVSSSSEFVKDMFLKPNFSKNYGPMFTMGSSPDVLKIYSDSYKDFVNCYLPINYAVSNLPQFAFGDPNSSFPLVFSEFVIIENLDMGFFSYNQPGGENSFGPTKYDYTLRLYYYFDLNRSSYIYFDFPAFYSTVLGNKAESLPINTRFDTIYSSSATDSSVSYQQGFDIGYKNGYDVGYQQKGTSEYNEGYELGYNKGLNESISKISPFSALVSGIDSFMQIRIFGSSVTLGLILSLSFGLVLLGIALKVFFHS